MSKQKADDVHFGNLSVFVCIFRSVYQSIPKVTVTLAENKLVQKTTKMLIKVKVREYWQALCVLFI